MTDTTTLTADQAREEMAYSLGVQAHLWGYPLANYIRTLPESIGVGGVGNNTYRKFPALKTAQDRFVVTPNNVTIDAYAMFDVTAEPMVVHVPALASPRWYLVQLGDVFDEVFHNVGGTKGAQPGDYVIVGPDFSGPLPGEMTRIPSRTTRGVVGARIFVNGEADLPAAVAAQEGFALMPLSDYLRTGLSFQPPTVALPEPIPSDVPAELQAFADLGRAMQAFLPASADQTDTFVAALGQIGLSVARGFAWQSLEDPTKQGLARAAAAADEIIDRRWENLGETTNGWRYNMAGGRAGHDFALRAALAKYMLGGQLATEVLYPNTKVDEQGEPFSGEHRYTLHFAADQIPPVATFWNLALYGDDMLFVENDLTRYSIGSTTDGLTTADDGSITLYVQHDKPEGDAAANWLPAPEGPFNLTMRFYGPLSPILDGSYRLPAVQRVG